MKDIFKTKVNSKARSNDIMMQRFNPKRLGFLRIVFSGGGQFDPLSFFKKNLTNINIILYNC